MNSFQSGKQSAFEEIAINEDAEQGVVSHMMHRPADIDLLSSIVRADDFHDVSLRRLFEMLVGMFSAGELIAGQDNIGVIATRLASSGLRKELGSELLLKLIDTPPVNGRHHALEVQRRANVRRLLQATESAKAAILNRADYQETIADLQATIAAIEARQADSTKSVHQLMQEELKRLDDWKPPQIMSGLEKVDSVFGGFVGGEVITVCAATSGGKSAFALQMGNHNGLKGRPVLFISLEMREAEKIKRLWRRGRGLAGVKFGRQKLNDEQLAAVQQETNLNANNRMHIAYMPTPTWRDIEAKVRAFRANHGLALVVIDYIGLVHKSDSRQTVQEKISEITSGMKRLAGQLDCVAMQLVQLNREGMKAKAVELHNMADSSSVERDSDIVLAINQTEEVDNGQREILVLKNRNGRRFRMTNFAFDGATMLFQEVNFCEFKG